MIPEDKINNNPEADATETVEIDLNEPVEVEDAQGDVNVASKLPPKGIYPLKFKSGKDEHPYAGRTKKEPYRSFVGTSLVGQFIDGEYEGMVVFENHINSLAMRGKPTSDLHHFLNIVGSPTSNKTTVGELLEHTRQVLENSPVGMAEVDWKASYKQDDGTYKDVVLTMEKFPRHYIDVEGKPLAKDQGGKWDGSYEQTIPHPKDGEPIQAQLYVRSYLSQSEAQKKKAASA